MVPTSDRPLPHGGPDWSVTFTRTRSRQPLAVRETAFACKKRQDTSQEWPIFARLVPPLTIRPAAPSRQGYGFAAEALARTIRDHADNPQDLTVPVVVVLTGVRPAGDRVKSGAPPAAA